MAERGWGGSAPVAWGPSSRSACSTPATTSRSTTGRGRRPSRSPSWARRSSTRRRTSPIATSSSRWSGGSQDFEDVALGEGGLLTRPDAAPALLIDSSTISVAASERVRVAAEARGTDVLAAPVSGNPKVAAAGRLTIAVSGPHDAFERALPYLEVLGSGVTYVGEGDRARLVKICHNLMLGVVAQTLAEITVLAEKGGVSRADFLAFLNDSVMGSTFTRYKSPAYVNLDFAPTFTPALLLKDFDLGFEAARELDVPLPVAAAARECVQALVGSGYTDVDFAALIELQAQVSGLDLVPEDVPVSDGLAPAQPAGRS